MRIPLAIPLLLLLAAPALADVGFRRDGGTLEVEVAGRPFTTYRFGPDLPKPFFWPIRGPFGDPVTRGYPNVRDQPGETQDHIWHRGLNFSQDLVGRPGKPPFDFWREGVANQGKIVHWGFDPAPTVEDGVLEFGSREDWVAPGGEVLIRGYAFWRIRDLGDGAVLMTLRMTLQAEGGPVAIGDIDEGTFAVRVATSMDEKREDSGPRSLGERGRVVNGAGTAESAACWGKPADWVDYSGIVAGKRVGIAMFDHPENRPRCRWHVRDYGLLSANVFGRKPFGDGEPGGIELVPGSPLALRYGVLVHAGDAAAGDVARRYREFAGMGRGD